MRTKSHVVKVDTKIVLFQLTLTVTGAPRLGCHGPSEAKRYGIKNFKSISEEASKAGLTSMPWHGAPATEIYFFAGYFLLRAVVFVSVDD